MVRLSEAMKAGTLRCKSAPEVDEPRRRSWRTGMLSQSALCLSRERCSGV